MKKTKTKKKNNKKIIELADSKPREEEERFFVKFSETQSRRVSLVEDEWSGASSWNQEEQFESEACTIYVFQEVHASREWKQCYC